MKKSLFLRCLAACLAVVGLHVVPAQAGTLSVVPTSLADVNSPIDLTAEGQSDWAYWGLNLVTDFDDKATGGGQISNCTVIGTNSASWYDNSDSLFSWSDGTPDSSATASSSGIYFYGLGTGYEVDVPADTTPRHFNLYAGTWGATMHFEAALSDGSAPTYIDETFTHDTSGGANQRYSIIYAANSPGQQLRVRVWTLAPTDDYGNVTLQAATLAPVPALSVSQPAITPASTVGAGTLVSLSVAAQGLFPYHYAWRVDSGSGFMPVSNSDTNTLLVDTTGQPGSFRYEVVVTNDAGGAVTSAPAALTVNVANGLMRVSTDDLSTVTEVDLTAEGTLDWAHWGITSPTDFDHKTGVTSQIGDYVPIGWAQTYYQYDGNAQGFTWTDGTPTASADDTATGIYAVGPGNGFEVDVSAQPTILLFKIYVGVYTPGGNLATLHLEASLSDASTPTFMDETLNGSANRCYSIIFKAGSPNQTLNVKYWALGGADGNVTLQAATLAPVPALSVTQPAFLLTNVVAVGSTVEASTVPQGPFPYHYQWQVNLGAGFDAIPNSDTNAIFVVASAPGSYGYRVTVTNDYSAESATSATATLTVKPATSTLVATSQDVASYETIDLTAEGTLDWAHWGLTQATDFDDKAGIVSLISNYSAIGSGDYYQYNGNGVGVTWTDGTPDATATDSATGIYVSGLGNGYAVQVPAAATNRVLKMYVGAWDATAHFDAMLSDGSSPTYFDETFTADGSQNRTYTITYAAPAGGQSPPTLNVRYWMLAGQGNVTLNSASLGYPITLSVARTAGGQVRLVWPQGTLLEATNLAGPWVTNVSASPLLLAPTEPQKFFRVQVP